MKENPTESRKEGKLYSLFNEWVLKEYSGDPTPMDWVSIINEDTSKARKKRETL